jgi:hypothetical protein
MLPMLPVIAVLGVTFLGDGPRDAADPYGWNPPSRPSGAEDEPRARVAAQELCR